MSRIEESNWLLQSLVPGVPDQLVKLNEPVFIGRNPICKIKDLKCSRRKLRVEIEVEKGGDLGGQPITRLKVTDFHTADRSFPREDDIIEGHGYRYLVKRMA